MKRVALVATAWLLITALAFGLAGRWQSHGAPITNHDRKVVVFGIPHLGFADLSPRTTPTLWRLIHTDAAIAATSIRSHDARPTTLEGYATLGAGSRLAAPDRGGLAVAADAPAGDLTAGEALTLRTGVEPDGDIVVPARCSGPARERRPPQRERRRRAGHGAAARPSPHRRRQQRRLPRSRDRALASGAPSGIGTDGRHARAEHGPG